MGDYYSGDGMDPGSSGSSGDREGNSKDKGTAKHGQGQDHGLERHV
jgi:hypothetical protein